jgi:murein DD-endopeptidase MepM/ murein hydrolase activator NlpD
MTRRVWPILLVLLVALAGTARAETGSLDLDGTLSQGGMVVGRVAPGTAVSLNSRTLRVGTDGVFVFGFGRDAPAEAILSLTHADGQTEDHVLAIARREYDVQRVDGLPDKLVTPPEDVLVRIRAEAAAVRGARAHDTPEAHFAAGFHWPAKGRISGVYGSQRILNGEPRRPHFGVDVAGPIGTPVVAPAAGTVTLAEPDLYYSGGTLIIDHGHGVSSTFLHLDRIDVAVGTVLVPGQPVGAIGETGRASGPHLDWRMNWFDQRLDPALLVGPMPETPES